MNNVIILMSFVLIVAMVIPSGLLVWTMYRQPSSRAEFLLTGLCLIVFASILVAMSVDYGFTVRDALGIVKQSEPFDREDFTQLNSLKRWLLVIGSFVGFVFGSTGAAFLTQAVVSDKPFAPQRSAGKGWLYHSMSTLIFSIVAIGMFFHIVNR